MMEMIAMMMIMIMKGWVYMSRRYMYLLIMNRYMDCWLSDLCMDAYKKSTTRLIITSYVTFDSMLCKTINKFIIIMKIDVLCYKNVLLSL